MILHVIGSGSEGNCYLLKSAHHRLIIECGVPFKKIQKALDFDYADVGCIVSHAHGDHSKSIPQLLTAGIKVYASHHTHHAAGTLFRHNAKTIISEYKELIGEYSVLPFPVVHDVPTFGFLIHHFEMGTTLFLTDTCYSPGIFPGINNIMIEANYSDEIINSNGCAEFLKRRIMKSHMSLATCKGLLSANDLSAVNNIVLLHLSSSNSDMAGFKQEVQDLTGKTVNVASNGLEIEFNKSI